MVSAEPSFDPLNERFMTPRDGILALKARMSQNIVGQEHILERLLIGLLANGNLLVEGLPGLAKTRAVKSLIEFRTKWMISRRSVCLGWNFR